MNNKTLIPIILILILVLGGLYLYRANSVKQLQMEDAAEIVEESPMDDEDLEKYMEEENSKAEDGSADTMMGEDGVKEDPAEKDAMKEDKMEKEAYVDYSVEALSEAQAQGKAVIFFHASWCPTCKVANSEFEENTSQIPEGVTVLKADYDSESELKEKYGITYQHTFVQVDENGEMITKWSGGDIDGLIENLE